MTLKGDAKFKRKLTCDLKNEIKNLVNFQASSWKSENLHFDELLLSKPYKVSDEKVRKNYVSWHWRVMQSLKKNWLLAPKITWGIWWILMRTVCKSENFHFEGLLLSIAYKVSAKKVQKSYLSWHKTLKKTDFLFENDLEAACNSIYRNRNEKFGEF